MTAYNIILVATGRPMTQTPFYSMTGAEIFRVMLPLSLSETRVELVESEAGEQDVLTTEK
jgi:hypothetical protein